MKKSEINVLVVDDDRAIGQTLSEAITRAGYKALVASRGDEALNMVRMKHVHAAVVDCMLPVMNGITLAEELRKTRFDNGTIVLMSGIFKDKSFEADAIKKTGAICYLQKPFGPLDLLSALKPKLESLIDTQQWTLQAILSKRLTSTRDRVKVVEHLEEVTGAEAAFVLSILMDAKVSGFLNLVSDSGSIFGVTIKAGQVVSVDSDNVDEASIRFLMDTGYLTADDWKEFEQKESKRAPLQKLVADGYISPHAAEQARRDQISSDLKKILRFGKLNINFVPDEQEDSAAVSGLELTTVFAELNDTLDTILVKDFLKSFFQANWSGGIKPMGSLSSDHPIMNLPIVKRMQAHLKGLSDDRSIEQLVAENPSAELDIMKAMYVLVILRQVLFVDINKIKAFENELSRRKKVLSMVQDKDPVEVFQYFGASASVKEHELEEIFKDFVKTNHPDRLPIEAPEELKKVTQTLFATVSGAHNTLAIPANRQAYNKVKQSKLAEQAMQAESVVAEGMELFRRGQFQKAAEKFNTSLEMSYRNDTYCLYVWAMIKAKNKVVAKADLSLLLKKLDELLADQKKNPHYFMALGMAKAAAGDPNAILQFEKALALEPTMVEARREINAYSPKDVKLDASNILTGDITQIVSQIFKRKAK